MAVLPRARVGQLSDPAESTHRQPYGAAGATRMPLFAWLATSAFIVYGTTIPFNFVPDLSLVHQHLARILWNPLLSPDTGSRVSIPDFTSNILLFMPFGCFGVWSLRRLRSRIGKVVLVTVLGVALSVAVETIQLFTIDRTSSVADVFANTLGGFCGGLGGIALGASVGTGVRMAAAVGLTDSAFLFPLLAATFVMLAGAWEPFDVTLDIGSVLPKLRLFLHDPLQLGPLTDEALSMMQHALFAATLFLWLRELRVRSVAGVTAIVGVAIACFAEGVQLFIAARMPGVWDAAIGSTGALAGIPIARALERGSLTTRAWVTALAVTTAIGVAMQQLSPFTLGGTSRAFQWMPFLNYYEFTTSETVSHSAELLLAYLPLGFGLALAARTTIARWLLVFGVAFAIAAPVEYLQQFIGGRFPDVTDIGLSVAGACLGAWTARTGWALFNAEMRIVADSTGGDFAPTRQRPGRAPSVAHR